MDLSAIPAIDGHAHPVLTAEAAARLPYPAFFTEAGPACAEGARESLFYKRSLRDIAGLLGCDADEAAIAGLRHQMGEAAWGARFLGEARLAAVLLDDGFPRADALTVAEMDAWAPSRRVLRLETAAEDILADRVNAGTFVERVREALELADVAAFKSIAAYRCGLRLSPRATDDLPPVLPAGRLTERAVIELVLGHALEVARARRIPIQLHCGFGDADQDLGDGDPSLLRETAARFPDVDLVLLHCWPYGRAAGWMASVFPNVYVDFGLAVPFCSTDGMRVTISEMLHLAPTTRILYSSDASRLPEMFWLGARHGRRVLGDVLERCVRDGDLTAAQAEVAARDILHDNAARLYDPARSTTREE